MTASAVRAGMLVGVLALCGSGFVLADQGGKPADKGKKAAAGRGKHWDQFVKKFDANGDGKVSKEEFLSKRPAFDKMDANKDGSVTAEEVKALPAVQKRGGTGAGFMERFDADHDGKVTPAEYDAKRTTLFEKLDKNKDGMIDQSEVKAQPQAMEEAAAP